MRSLRKGLVFTAGLVALCVASEASAAGKWAVGGFVDYNSPQRGMKKRFSGVSKFSAAIDYVKSDLFTVAIEYNRADFKNGKLETLPFTWAVDNKKYTSPAGRSTMKLNTLAVNGIVYPGSSNQSHGFKAKDYRWYVVIGGGYCDYKAENKNFIYPGQTGGVTKTLNPATLMEPQMDKRVALTANVGAGVEAFISDSWAIDVRWRYNIIVGEIRPLLLWNLERIFPIQFMDIGAGMKFYFWR